MKMIFTLPCDLETFVEDELRKFGQDSPDDVLREAMELLKDQRSRQEVARTLIQLRLQPGGEEPLVIELRGKEELQYYFDELKEQLRTDLLDDLKEGLLAEVRQEIVMELKEELEEELRSSIQDDIEMSLGQSLKDEIMLDLKAI